MRWQGYPSSSCSPLCLAILLEKDNPGGGVMLQGMFRSNFVLFGIPISTAPVRGYSRRVGFHFNCCDYPPVQCAGRNSL